MRAATANGVGRPGEPRLTPLSRDSRRYRLRNRAQNADVTPPLPPIPGDA